MAEKLLSPRGDRSPTGVSAVFVSGPTAHGFQLERTIAWSQARTDVGMSNESPSTRRSSRSCCGAMKMGLRLVRRLAYQSPSSRTFRARKGSRMRPPIRKPPTAAVTRWRVSALPLTRYLARLARRAVRFEQMLAGFIGVATDCSEPLDVRPMPSRVNSRQVFVSSSLAQRDLCQEIRAEIREGGQVRSCVQIVVAPYERYLPTRAIIAPAGSRTTQ
jgi:hypothetical protein